MTNAHKAAARCGASAQLPIIISTLPHKVKMDLQSLELFISNLIGWLMHSFCENHRSYL